jgi:hypothetical protein
MKKKKDELDSNLVNDLFYTLKPERKVRNDVAYNEEPEEVEDDPYYEQLKAKKRARIEALRNKSRGLY